MKKQTLTFTEETRTWRASPENVAEFCAQVNRFAESHYAEMERIRTLGLAGKYQAACDIVIKLEKIARIIGARRLSRLLSELRLCCSSLNANHNAVMSLISTCEIEFSSLRQLAIPKGKIIKSMASS